MNDANLVIGISSRALFDLEEAHCIYEKFGVDAYAEHQMKNEDEVLQPGVAFSLVKKFLSLSADGARAPIGVEVVLLSRNSADTGLRIFNSILHYGLDIRRAAFSSGAPVWPFAEPFGVNLFLSADAESVSMALDKGIAAATLLPSQEIRRKDASVGKRINGEEIRIAFDGDAVLFGDESERLSREGGLDAFSLYEKQNARVPLSGGPFRGFLSALHQLQLAYPAALCPIRTALVTARCAPAHERVIRTLREWGIRLDEALFLGGRPKGPFLQAFGADIFFDDSPHNIDSAREHVAAGHVPHGVMNR